MSNEIEPINIDGLLIYHFVTYSLDDNSCLTCDLDLSN